MESDEKEYYLKIFGKEVVDRFSVDQLKSNITFILNFPNGDLEETKTYLIPSQCNLKKLFEDIKKIVVNKNGYTTTIQYKSFISSVVDPDTNRTVKIEDEKPKKYSEDDKGTIDNLNENVFKLFRNHYSFEDKALQQTLELDVFFTENKFVRFYVITQHPLDEKSTTKAKQQFDKLFKSYKSADNGIIFRTDYPESNLEKEDYEKMHIIVDDNFMKIVVENEINRANTINILADIKNTEAKAFKAKYKDKIKEVNSKIETLFGPNKFNF